MSGVDPRREALAWFKYLSQGRDWVPNGKPALPIADMDAAWRHNAANWLLKRAGTLAFRYGVGELEFIDRATGGETAGPMFEEALGDAQQGRAADPEAWLKATELYQALVKDLPDNVAELARHWSTCDLRTGQGPACSCPCGNIPSARTEP